MAVQPATISTAAPQRTGSLGNAGADYIEAGVRRRQLFGGDGRDYVDASYGADSIDGGNEVGAGDTVYAGADNDTVNGGDGDDYLYGDHGVDSASPAVMATTFCSPTARTPSTMAAPASTTSSGKT